ncbi:MAG: IS1595 family transposase [Gammaproteobacteria bacterium]|nr:IS1595 family transposase [Gammaproteobacteria bacterium]
MNNAPGQHYRKGITLIEAVQKFGDEATAEAWFVERRWPNGIRCPKCDSDAISHRKGRRQTPQYHCNGCQANFTVKTDTIMHNSKLPLSKWALAFYLYSTNLKGVSSMKLHRDLGITQKSAWHLVHRIREVWNDETAKMAGPVEVDETYMGGKERNKHVSQKLKVGGSVAGKTAVVGLVDRTEHKAHAQVVTRTNSETLQGFIHDHVHPEADVYTDEAKAYRSLSGFWHACVNHGEGQYVDGMAHTNGIESFWSMLKRSYVGTYHKMSPKHLNKYLAEFSGRYNIRRQDTQDQLAEAVAHMVGRRLSYRELIADNGLASGARS